VPETSASLTVDTNNRINSPSGFTYDGDGKRVQKSNGTLYWYGAGSDALDETDLSGNLANEYIYFAGRRVARRDSSSNIYFYFEDHLGTSRVVTNATGTGCYDADFYPYGGERIYTNTCPQNYKFTGKERDAESGLDDMVARFYSSGLGRFVIADWSASPEPVPFADMTNPQTLNLYAYVKNNPLRYTDATGHAGAWPLGSGPDPSAMGPMWSGRGTQLDSSWSNFVTVEHQWFVNGAWWTISVERVTAQELQDRQRQQQQAQHTDEASRGHELMDNRQVQVLSRFL
jgi:RHS repeat-associated protein